MRTYLECEEMRIKGIWGKLADGLGEFVEVVLGVDKYVGRFRTPDILFTLLGPEGPTDVHIRCPRASRGSDPTGDLGQIMVSPGIAPRGYYSLKDGLSFRPT